MRDESENNILLVEDNEGDVLLAKEALKFIGSGSNIIPVNNGESLFEYFNARKNDTPDVIILDLNLPGMNGTEILKILKTDPETENIPVIVFSTSNNQNDIDRCYELKADEYITKPIDLNEFFEVFRHIDKLIKHKVSDKVRIDNGKR
ncbi:MAG: response regulator [Candidatus Delongbacteria bacterium]|nr:response regulator [Candidatus Delongbacteria bacterium]MDD4205274.1 response regulator [Candidatus Delongbacteria bacterium]